MEEIVLLLENDWGLFMTEEQADEFIKLVKIFNERLDRVGNTQHDFRKSENFELV